MATRVTFASFPNGLQPIPTALDTAFDDVLKLTIIPCTATGTNTIALTPVATVYPPDLTAYASYMQFSFVPVNSTTGSATVNVNGVGAKNLYLSNGTTQAGSGNLVAGQFYTIAYSSALNSNVGGFYVTVSPTVSPTFTGTMTAEAGTFSGQLIGKGTATNDAAAAGYIGEFLSSAVASASAVSLTSATWANVTSILLTAGDWDVWGVVAFKLAGTTTTIGGFASVSTASASGASDPAASGNTGVSWAWSNAIVGNVNFLPAPAILASRFTLASTTTVFLEAYCNFSVSTCGAYGVIYARRRR